MRSDARLLHALYRQGGDLFARVAAAWHKKPLDRVSKLERDL